MAVNDAPLPAQIDKAEQLIVLRRLAVSRNMKRLSKDVRQGLATPAALLATAGLGLAIGVLLKHRIQATADTTVTKGGETQSGKMAHIFGNLLKIIAMVRTLAAALPPDRICRTQPKPGSKS